MVSANMEVPVRGTANFLPFQGGAQRLLREDGRDRWVALIPPPFSKRWAGVFGHRPFAFSISMGVKTSDGMNWNLQDLVYEALSEEWRKRDGEDDDPWENHGPDGYQPPSYEPVNPERRTAQTPSDGLI